MALYGARSRATWNLDCQFQGGGGGECGGWSCFISDCFFNEDIRMMGDDVLQLLVKICQTSSFVVDRAIRVMRKPSQCQNEWVWVDESAGWIWLSHIDNMYTWVVWMAPCCFHDCQRWHKKVPVVVQVMGRKNRRGQMMSFLYGKREATWSPKIAETTG